MSSAGKRPQSAERSKIERPERQKAAAAAVDPHSFVITPQLGAILRATHEALTDTVLSSLEAQGIAMTKTELSLMRYPGPDGVRPIVLAQRCNMTKQALNYVLAGLVDKGYVERKSVPEGRARMVFLTAKGWSVLSVQRRAALAAEQQWAKQIGARRFDAMREGLFELAIWLGKIEAPETTTTNKSGVPKKPGKY